MADWVGKTTQNVDFRPVNRYILETVEDKHIVTVGN